MATSRRRTPPVPSSIDDAIVVRRSPGRTDDARPNGEGRLDSSGRGHPIASQSQGPCPDVAQGGEERHAREVVERRRRAAADPRRRGPRRRATRTGCSRARPRRRPGCWTPTAPSCTCSTRRPGSSSSRTRRASSTSSRTTGSASCGSRSARACSARPWPSAGSWSPRTTSSDRSFSHVEGPDRFVDEVGVRSLVVAPLRRRHGGVRRARHVLPPPGRVHRAPDRARPLARRARGVRDGQRAPDRRARPLAPGRRAPGARRALAARARHPDLGRPGSRGRRPVHDRRGAPPARRRRRADRHRRSRRPPPARHVLVGRRGDPRDRVAARPERLARGGRLRPGGHQRRDLHLARLHRGSEPPPRHTGRTPTSSPRASTA